MVLNFDMNKYSKLQEAYKLMNKSLIAMDQVSHLYKLILIKIVSMVF